MRRLGYVPALDGVRGIAIAAVVLFHFFGLPGGFLGVDLFFVLSGFLITTLLLEDGRLGRFYRRRARRLLPALGLLLMVCGVALIGWARTLEGGIYVGNFVRAFARPDPLTGSPVDHLWSLATEEQFYLVWPLVLLATLGRRRRLALALAALFAVLVAYRIGLTLAGASLPRVYFSPDTHADGLVLGSLAALVRPRISAALARAALVSLIALFAIAGFSIGWLAFGLPLFEVAAIVVVLAAVDGRLPELEIKPLVWLGLISYSLYLWHEPVRLLDHGHHLAALPVAVGLAVVSYRFVEQPFRRGRPSDHALDADPGVKPGALAGHAAAADLRA